MLDTARLNLRYARRQLWRTPVSTTIATLSLAVGICVAVSAFSLANGAFLRPLPVPASDRLFHVGVHAGHPLHGTRLNDSRWFGAYLLDYQDFANSGVFASVAARA